MQRFTKQIKQAAIFLCIVSCIAALVFTAVPTVARADGGISLSTTFPGISVNAGKDVTFTITVANDSASAQTIGLSAASMPEGWTGKFVGNSSPVTRVYVNGSDSVSVSFIASVPADTPEGPYKIDLLATGDNGATDTFELELNVTGQEITQGKFSSQYPTLQGASTATFAFPVDLVNNSAEAQSYSLSASAPEGWQTSIMAASKQIASLSLDKGSTQNLTVNIIPPQNVTAGEYKISCAAVSANETLKTDLTVVITGTYSMTLSTPTGLLSADAYAGRTSDITLSLTNTGSSDLSNVVLTATAPNDWAVSFDEKSIDTLAAGETKQVIAHIKASSDAIAGDYVVSMSASTNETSSQADFRVAVKTSTLWGIVGVVIILALIAGLVFLFRKFGRR